MPTLGRGRDKGAQSQNGGEKGERLGNVAPMTRQETAQILAILRAAYPRQTITAEQYKAMVAVWADSLADMPFEAGKLAVKECREISKWLPSISEFKEIAEKYWEAEMLRISWRCCPMCQVGPMVHDHCPHCSGKLETEAAEVPQLEGVNGGRDE